MPLLQTKNFGPIHYEEDAALDFPRGLPGFEERRRFVVLHFDGTDPLFYLQSLEDSGLCFLTMPVRAVEPSYRLQMAPEDMALIGLPPGPPKIGRDTFCLAVLSLSEEGPTANLLAPIVVNLRNRKSVQAVAAESGYSHQQPLVAEEAMSCS
jgi:flagellar assembly factor FliW